MVAADGGRADPLEIPTDAHVERLRRRVAALERQLEARITQVDELRHRLEELDRHMAGAGQEADVLRRKAAEYDLLMQTFTMRTLSRPRQWYASARRRLGRR